jgi:phage gp45-like
VRRTTGRAAVEGRAAIRRLVIAATPGGLWQLLGHEDETEDDAPAFQGIGFASRPTQTSLDAGNAEAILVKIGGKSAHPVIVATRDESIRVELEAGETAIFNEAGALAKLTKDGDVEINCASGRKVYLRTDGGSSDALVRASAYDAHVHPSGTGPTGVPDNAGNAGTSNVEGE